MSDGQVIQLADLAPDPAGGAGAAMVIRGAASNKPRTAGSVLADGEDAAPFTFRERETCVLVPIGRVPGKDLALDFECAARLHGVELVRLVRGDFPLRELRLISARRGSDQDIERGLRSTDGEIASLRPGQAIELEFEATPVPAGLERSFVLHAVGRYERLREDAPEAGAPVAQLDAPFLRAAAVATDANVSVEFGVPGDARLDLAVFDVRGRRVARLVSGLVPAGRHETTWNAGGLPAGVYFVRLTREDVRRARAIASARIVLAGSRR